MSKSASDKSSPKRAHILHEQLDIGDAFLSRACDFMICQSNMTLKINQDTVIQNSYRVFTLLFSYWLSVVQIYP